MASFVVSPSSYACPSDEDRLSFSTSSSSSVSDSPKRFGKGLSIPAETKSQQQIKDLKQKIGKGRQLLSSKKGKIAQLQSECKKLEAKSGTLEALCHEIKAEKQKPKRFSEQIALAKEVFVQLTEDIAGLNAALKDSLEVSDSLKNTGESLLNAKGEALEMMTLVQCRDLFKARCDAIERIQTTLNRKLEEAREADMCIVCVSQPREVILVPCGHLVMCRECSDTLRQCPVCRAIIEDRYSTGRQW